MIRPEILFTAALPVFLGAFIGHAAAAGLGSSTLYGHARRLAWLGCLLTMAGLGLRWQEAGHPPLSNMYESLVTLAACLAWIAQLFTWRTPLGLAEGGASVLAVLMMGLASLFPSDIKPLVPALQSHWLHLHVFVAFLGEACFGLAFLLSYLYCLVRLLGGRERKPETRAVPPPTGLEYGMCALIVFGLPIGFLGGMLSLLGALRRSPDPIGIGGLILWVIVPAVLAVTALPVALYLWRGSAGRHLDAWLPTEDRLDEYTYRAIALGFPLFAVGALIFGMVWASRAWGRFWGWDPKETWALVTFLVYAVYLHLRLTRGWRGTWTAAVSVLGFLVTLFTLFGVNLLLSGLHAYASW